MLPKHPGAKHPSPVPILRQGPDWRPAYESVLRENDRNLLFERIEVAEAAMRTRHDALSQLPGHDAERRALEEALANLLTVKSEFLGFPNLEGNDFKSPDQKRNARPARRKPKRGRAL